MAGQKLDHGSLRERLFKDVILENMHVCYSCCLKYKINLHVLQEDLDRDNLAPLSAQSLYRLLEEHSSHPLHAAVRLGREDVVFLDLIKYTQQVKKNCLISNY